MQSQPSRFFLATTLVVGLAIGAAGAAVALSGANRRDAAPANAAADRSAIERLLADRAVSPTGTTKRFELTVKEAAWELLPGVTTRAITFNGTVPGPTIRVTEGDTVEIAVTNGLTEGTSVHWHGLHVPNAMDGVAGVTQDAIAPGQTFTYRFVAPHAGTFMYHSHGPNSREQIDRGLYAPFIIDPADGDPIRADREVVLALQGWMVGASTGGAGGAASMPGMDSMSMNYDYFTINGKSFPATAPIEVEQGQLVRLRFINPSQTIHPMHLHGMDMAVIAKDGEPLVQPQRVNTVDILPGDTFDVVFNADNPGTWLLHCHDLHHASNAGVEPGGLIVTITVKPRASQSSSPSGAATSPAVSAEPSAMPGATMTPIATVVPAMPGMTSMPGMTP